MQEDTQSYVVRNRTIDVDNYITIRDRIPKVATPRVNSWETASVF